MGMHIHSTALDVHVPSFDPPCADAVGLGAATRVSPCGPVGHTGAMGFNPHLKTDKTPADFLLVIAALVVCAGLVIWGVFG